MNLPELLTVIIMLKDAMYYSDSEETGRCEGLSDECCHRQLMALCRRALFTSVDCQLPAVVTSVL